MQWLISITEMLLLQVLTPISCLLCLGDTTSYRCYTHLLLASRWHQHSRSVVLLMQVTCQGKILQTMWISFLAINNELIYGLKAKRFFQSFDSVWMVCPRVLQACTLHCTHMVIADCHKCSEQGSHSQYLLKCPDYWIHDPKAMHLKFNTGKTLPSS